ncbi:hypothetical protein KAFR_0D03650 [Kazachstania africana CBS 2517]|uniref:CN hydrolase domain-containing protein n=1 Tax=Kazachstania africana (strain ATCC 22294 / BCRC 22015 / CBS 2517 / CECT 1963 / NBRC 1671 / NRRL Y-8276) TaxID=1071382 RepID=H2AUG3_KAZAF|nr:hypothetical protein KAFR_0D03650 [Kazachstania africana CBS 2517]CCF58013.1 hypothetical protein KAFR_0D03650 [Kazachstania africana CBS 2517]
MPNVLVDLRIALVQLNPQLGKLDSNIRRAWTLLNKFNDQISKSKKPDIVVFPEFALTGYNFHSREQIKPYLCHPQEGPSYELAKEVSKKFNCYTVIGYPEKSIDNDEKCYNSALVMSPLGKLVFNYRKSFLYETDKQWQCEENPQRFEKFKLSFPSKNLNLNCAIGICMDLSPYEFKAPFNDFEFSSFCLENDIELIICPMAWLHSSSITSSTEKADAERKKMEISRNLATLNVPIYGSQGNFHIDIDNNNKTSAVEKDSEKIGKDYRDLCKPDMSNVNYWILRFLPFVDLSVRKDWFDENLLHDIWRSESRKSYIGATKEHYWKMHGKNAVLAIANRCGVEDGTTLFAGSSGFYKFNGNADNSTDELKLDSTNKSVEMLGNLGKGHEGIIMRDVHFEVQR